MNRAEFKDPGLVGELGVQCVESEKLEQAQFIIESVTRQKLLHQ